MTYVNYFAIQTGLREIVCDQTAKEKKIQKHFSTKMENVTNRVSKHNNYFFQQGKCLVYKFIIFQRFKKHFTYHSNADSMLCFSLLKKAQTKTTFMSTRYVDVSEIHLKSQDNTFFQ